ncbi:hypothetical protein B0A54_08165 [Friedmanniomyces endolithicus]|uniref:Phosphoglycerate mutase-like protein n=1 Tax=Friedmanniomyces endolithicus TaxID=329885 RepID=A0A4V5N809_9PEZI|nr:hypothetical protein LTS09_012741 [Friedmanniomyces endolithicus]KAK0306378.1 hypothetical protein LTR01_006236 [Friedmanniomyces endolithicus]KAK0825008.1 hypothetical protein LTR73_007295 [Friedmanniomyces endolithicus]TKA41739.1 hypothetical protein B0A54_08165 [Friedmanniomyces endolithicus]
MAPHSRIILVRHAQAEHNVTFDWSIPDAPLTPLGKTQATALAPLIPQLQREVDLIATSPLTRTVQTTLRAFAPAITRLGGPGKIALLPQAQEVNAVPCDTGRSRSQLEHDPDFAGLDLEPLVEGWNSKSGFWAADEGVVAERAAWVRRWLRSRKEGTIVLVAHGDILRRIVAGPGGVSGGPGWKNAEVRVYRFDSRYVEGEECYLDEKGVVAAAGGWDVTSTEAQVLATEGGAEIEGKL